MMHHLRHRWEAYLRVPLDAASRQMKLAELEKFLHAVLKWTADDNEVPQFGDMRSVSNILAGEFLVDIHRICSESEEEDVSHLQEYLLSGRGSVILKVLGTIGVKGLSCGRELGELLVTLLPMCMKFPAEHPRTTEEVQLCGMESCFISLSTVRTPSSPSKFPELTEVGRRAAPSRPWSRTGGATSTESAFFRSLHHHHHHHQKHRSARHQSSSDSGDCEEPPLGFGRYRSGTPAPRLLNNSPSHLGVFPGVIHGHSSTEELSGAPSEDGDLDDLPKLRTHSADLCILLLTLLKDLSHDDGPHVDNKKSVSMSLMPSLADQFHNFHMDINSGGSCAASGAESGSDTEDGDAAGELPDGWRPKDLIVLERYMVRVLHTMANNVSEQSNGLTVLLANGALATILDVAWSVVKGMEATRPAFAAHQESARFLDQLVLVSDIVHGCWLLMQSIFTSIPLNPSILKTALKLFHDVVANHGLQLAESTLLQWEKLITNSETLTPGEAQGAKDTVVSIVATISRVIVALKKSKIDYVHAVKCSRRRHKRCDYTAYMHHHHDILGLSGYGDHDLIESTGYGSMEALHPPAAPHHIGGFNVCAVASLGEFVLQLYQKSLSKVLQVRLLRCLEEAGVCCCMLPASVIKLLLLNIEAQSSAVRSFILSVLVKVLLDQCGGSGHGGGGGGGTVGGTPSGVQLKHEACNICREEESGQEAGSDINVSAAAGGAGGTRPRRTFLMRRQETSDSALSGSDASLPEDGPVPAPKWRCLKQFQPLILSDDEEMNVQAMQHMLRFVSQGSAALLRELFYCIFLPVLQASRQQFLKPEPDLLSASATAAVVEWELDSEISTGVVQYCLRALPVLLHSATVHDMFLNFGGVKQLAQLVQVEALRRCVLKVFQVLIVLDEKKQLLDNQGVLYLHYDAGPNTDDDAGEEGGAGGGADKSSPQRKAGGGEAATVLDAFIELLFQGIQRNAADSAPTDWSGAPDECANSATSTSTLTSTTTTTTPAFAPKELSKLCDIWMACDGLFTQSRKFRHEFLKRDGPASAYDILVTSLRRLSTSSKDNVGHFSIYSTDVNSEFGCVLALAQSALNVCLTCCTSKALFSSEELSMSTLLAHVKQLIVESELLECDNLNVVKVLFDMLLSCSTARYSRDGKNDIVQNHTFAVMHLRGDDPIYDHELQELSDPCSARETETCFTEQGYEADSEFTPEEHGKGHSKKNGSRRRMRPVSNTVAYPELCHLVLELLIRYDGAREDTLAVVPHVLLKLISLAKHSAEGATMLYEQGIVPTLLNGFHRAIVSKEPQHQVLQRLALDLFTVISTNSFSSHELKNFIMLLQQPNVAMDGILSTLILLTESHKPQPTHFLHFPVIKSLLGTDFEISVRSLSSDCLTASIRQMPHQTTELSHTTYADLSVQLKSASGALQWKTGTYREQQPTGGAGATTSDGSTQDSYGIPGATARSPANCASMQVSLRDNSLWPTNNKGFSISMWLKIVSNVQDMERDENYHSSNGEKKQAFSKGRSSPINPYRARNLPAQLKATLRRTLASRHWSDTCLHIVSLGNKDKMLEVWTDPEVANLIFRLVTHYRDEERVLSEATINVHLEQDTWQHLTITYSERVQGMEGIRTLGTVTTIIDGCFQKEVQLEYMNNYITCSPSNDSRLFIGHGVSLGDMEQTTGSWQLGNLFLFKDTLVTKHISFHLYALGPDCVTLSEVDSADMTAEYTHHISDDVVLHSGLSHDVFTGNQSIYLHHLRENLMVAYHPKAATDFCLYNQPSPFKPEKTGFKGMLSSGSVRGAFNPKMHQPTKVPARLLTDIAPKTQKGLRAAISEIGGIGVFLFMFAKVVEQDSTEKQQAEALRLLFTLMRNDPHNAQEFITMSGYEMLTKVFSSARSVIGYHVLKVLLDKCTTKPMFSYSRACGEFQLDRESEALICDVHVITAVLLAWRVWERAEPDVWQTAFRALEVLLRDDHPHRSFNVRQLQSAGVVEKLLNMCLERLQDSYPSLPLAICLSVITLIGHLVGSPPEVQNIILLCDFLLLAHPAASTYVNHTPSRFYFAHKWRRSRGRKSRGSVSLSTASTGHSSLQASGSTSGAMASTPVTSTPVKRRPTTAELPTSDSSPEELSKLDEILDNNHVSLQRSQSLPDSLSWWQKRLQLLRGGFSAAEPDLEPIDLRKRSETFPRTSRAQTDLRVTPSREVELCDFRSRRGDFPVRAAHVTDVELIHPELSKAVGSDVSDTRDMDSGDWPVPSTARVCKSASPVLQRDAFDVMDNVSAGTADSRSGGASSAASTHAQEDESLGALPLWGGRSEPVSPSSAASEDWTMYANANCKGATLRVNAEGEEDAIEQGEEGLVKICTGIIELLAHVIVSLPDSDVRKILGVILRPEMLIVMAHHNSVDIRTSIVRLLDVYLHRATKEQEDAFLRVQGFHLLASQLHQHAATTELAEACVTILLGRPHILEDDLDSGMLCDLRPVQQMAVVPVLALLENSVVETSLCHNLLCLVHQVFRGVPSMALVMLCNGLMETLCNVTHTLNAQAPRPTDLGGDEKQLLLADLQQLFCTIAEKTFSTSGISYYQQMEDSISLLQLLENRQCTLYGVESEELQNIKILYCCFLQSIYDHINGKLDTPSGFQLRKSSITNAVGNFLSKFNPIVDPELGIGMPAGYKYRQAQAISMPSSLSMLTTGLPDMIHTSGFTVSGNRVRSHSVSEKSRRLSNQTNMDIFAAALLGGKKASLSQNELLERFKKILTISVDYIHFSAVNTKQKTPSELRLTELVENSIEVVAMEKEFSRSLLEFLLKAIIIGMERSFFQRKSTNTTVMWQAKDVLRVQFCRLLTHMMAPTQDLQQRLFAVSLLANESKCKEVLKLAVHINQTGQRLSVYTYEILASSASRLDRAQRDETDELVTCLHQLGVSSHRLGAKLTNEQHAAIDEEMKSWEAGSRRERKVWVRRLETTGHRILHKLDNLAKKISTLAMDVTQTVNNTQNSERKKFLEHVKRQMSNGLQVKKAWQQLIQQLSHERAVWHCPLSHPPSWQLDPTEGPFRMRRRLQRCHLAVEPRHMKEEHRDKLDAEQYSPPLAFLFEEDNLTSDSAALIYKLHTSENIQHTCTCTSVTPSSETTGVLLIGQNDIYFVADQVLMDANYTQTLLGDKDLLFMTLPHEEVKEIHRRWYQLKDHALEIFLTNGKTSLIAFSTTKERDQIYSHLTTLELPNLLLGENLAAIQQLWLDGKMTNFEYLTHLNKIAGRSFNDLMQYPVFPFVLANYAQETLDLDDPTSYRNLSKPIAVQQKSREQRYVDNYKWLANEKKKHMNEPEPEGEGEYRPEPYHYGSHYSNSGTVLHFLVRMPPFTQMFLSYQDSNFDIPDRTFHDMQTSWRLASFESTTDVKELIPEFFFFPEYLRNNEGFDMGVRQGGQSVWDVGLPPWCPADNPRLFVLIHRQALESECVSSHLANWVDLVFGNKQTGRLAVEAVNVFHPATYFGKDVDSVADPLRRQALRTMIKTYGQTPRQLFRSPHPILQGHGLGMAMWGGDKPRLSRHRLNPVKSVKGLKWGMFVGSPDLPDPLLTWLHNYGSVVESLVALPTGEVFGVGACSSLLVMYSKEKGVTSVHTVDVLWAAIISWSHPDSIIRVKNRKDLPAINFLNWNTDDHVTCCASVPDCRLLFFGTTSGVISVHSTKFNSSKQSHLQVFGRRLCLYGHSAAVSALYVCKAYSVVVSASHDRTCIIWDLNRLTYVTSITEHAHPVHTLTVSETLGDIASVSHAGEGSRLMLHTINGERVAEQRCGELILCLAFSTLPEGRAVNVLVGGLSSGTIRMWSSWDLLPVRDIMSPKFTYPIVSITFTHDCQKLFAANSDGAVAVWEKTANTRPKDMAFIPFL